MKNFDAYAAYYDAFNRDKDYAGESAYIDALIKCRRPNARSLLELGCGTGRHSVPLTQAGYRVVGVDRSQAMISRARCHATEAAIETDSPEFLVADLRSLRLQQRFDVVLLLFHVMSYQVTNDDLRSAMATVSEHLAPDGLVIFDCWYGPGVFTDPPTPRIRRISQGDTLFTRIAEPKRDIESNRVDVHYEILIERNQSQEIERIREIHSMRYLFTPEIDFLLSEAGLSRVASYKWMTDSAPDSLTWNACYIAEFGKG